MNTVELGLILLPLGIALLAAATLFQMYTVLSEIYTLNRFKGTPTMMRAALALFFSFSLALYYFCPNARKKGLLFLLLGGCGVICYGLGTLWLLPYMKH